MSYSVAVLSCVITVIAVCWAKLPDGYILQVTPACGASATADGSIAIITDLNAEAMAVCASDNTVPFTTTDNVNFNLAVSYPGEGSQSCIFKKRQNSLVFYINVVVSYGETGSLVHQQEEEYTVTCTFDPRALQQSTNQGIVAGLIAPNELQLNMGDESVSTFTLNVVNVLGNSMSNVQLGRTVMLRGVTSGSEGLRPVSCDAIDGEARYAILRAGCGDGIIFPKDAGFITVGPTTTSPYFKAFSINAATVLDFECNFVTCTLDNCDGSSC